MKLSKKALIIYCSILAFLVLFGGVFLLRKAINGDFNVSGKSEIQSSLMKLDDDQFQALKSSIEGNRTVLNFSDEGASEEMLGSTFIRPTIYSTTTASYVTRLNWVNATGTNLDISTVLRVGSALTISSDGYIRTTGRLIQGTVYDDLVVPMSATRINPVTSKPDSEVLDGAITALAFDATSTETVTFSAQIPHGYVTGSGIYPHLHLAPKGAGAGDALFELSCVSSTIGAIFNTASTTRYEIIPMPGVANQHQMPNLTAGAPTSTFSSVSAVLNCALSRVGGSALDTYGDDIYVHSFDWHIPVNRLGTDL